MDLDLIALLQPERLERASHDDDELAPVIPGEMLREELLKEYGLSEPAGQSHRYLAQPERRDRQQPPADQRPYREVTSAAAGRR